MTQYRYAKLAAAAAADATQRPGRLPISLVENARLEGDRRKRGGEQGDRRQSERAIVDATAILSASFSDGVEGHLFNLSAHGCSIEVPGGSFTVDDSVWFQIESVDPWKGRICWVKDDKVGVEFDEPFYPAAFDLIVKSNKPVACSKVVDLFPDK